jgi:Zn-dependent protease with chaperone function
MRGGETPRGLACPRCGGGLTPPPHGAPEVAVLTCPSCGEAVRARRRNGGGRSGEHLAPRLPSPEEPPLGGLGLALRAGALRGLEWTYAAGLHGGAAGLLMLGGFVPVGGAWLRDEVASWTDVIERLGGVRARTRSKDPDADVGPVLGRGDAPILFEMVASVGRKLGSPPPQQVRLTYLPCCGVTTWGRRDRALFIGLPLLDALDRAELRAVLAHELAHLARGDARRAARATQFVEGLGRELDGVATSSRSPLRLWARLCRSAGESLYGPVARGQEARADRAAATIAGGAAAASALVKVALLQPLFREVLHRYDPAASTGPNLYAFFREFWSRLPEPLLTSLRHRLLTRNATAPPGAPHPGLLDRLALVQSYPDRPAAEGDHAPAASVLGDLEAMEQMLHNRLFALVAIEPSIFHRAGT